VTGLLLLAFLDAKLQLDLSPGLVRKYEVSRDYTAPVEKDQTGFVEEVVYRVEKERVEDRAKVNVSYTLLKRSMDGQSLPPPSELTPTVVWEERASNGLVGARQEIPYEGIDRQRQLRVLDVMFPADPIRVGTSWGRDVSEDKGDGFAPAHWQWTCTGLDEKTVVLKLTFQERKTRTPVNAEGTVTVDKKSGWIESADVTLHNTVVPGNTENIVVDLHVVWRKL
jgi:hypothetical protein